MEKQRLEEFKRLFLQIKKANLVHSLTLEDFSGEEVSGDNADQSMRERDGHLQVKLQGRQNYFNKKIEAALERIENGSYGECDDCGEEISIKRLVARPTADLCISCKEEREREEEVISYDKRSHTHGREIINQNLEAVKSLSNRDEANLLLNKEKIIHGQSVS